MFGSQVSPLEFVTVMFMNKNKLADGAFTDFTINASLVILYNV